MTPDKFWDHVDIGFPDDCWEWQQFCNRAGYGIVRIRDDKKMAHRVAWELAKGPLRPHPEECVLHRCDNPPCCNPAHLFKGTQKDNVRDCKMKGRTARQTGVTNGRARLCDGDILRIRDMAAAGATHKAIAAWFKVSSSNITKILNGQSWRSINAP